MYNQDEYSDAIRYDTENANTYELEMLLRWLGTDRRRVVELGCGTGRLTVPLALAGYDMVGVDLSEVMLAEAKRKASDHGISMQWIQTDMLEWEPQLRYDAIILAANTFQHLLTLETQERLVQHIYRLLTPNGLFVFDTRNPTEEELSSTDYSIKSHQISLPSGEIMEVYYDSNYNAATQVQSNRTLRVYSLAGEHMRSEESRIDLRFVEASQLNSLLCANGFTVEQMSGDWNGAPLTSVSKQIVTIATHL